MITNKDHKGGIIMNDKMSKVKDEVWNYFKDSQSIFLATSEENQPRVRPVTLIYFDKRFWITTGTDNHKVLQIQKNPKIEFCLIVKKEDKQGYVRGTGLAKIVKDKEQKGKIAKHCDFFSDFWESPDDPDYTLIEVSINEIEYLKPDEINVCKFKI